MIIILLAACTSATHTEPVAPLPEPAPTVTAPVAATPEAPAVDLERYPSKVLLDGVEVPAAWDDGDTFASPPASGDKPVRARMKGFNTLESYAAVHQWGDWTPSELHALAEASGERARSETWTCSDTGEGGGYGRLLVDCPDLRLALLREGYAHVFSMEAPADPEALAAQQEAIDAKVGIWAKGAPEGLLTSLHSLDEKENQESTYNRVITLSTGVSSTIDHSDTYTACQQVCAMGSCLTYIPYAQRYGEGRTTCETTP